MKKFIRFIAAILVACSGTLFAGEGFVVISAGKSGGRPKLRVVRRGLSSKDYDKKNYQLELELPTKEQDQTTEIELKTYADCDLSISLRGRYDVANSPSKRKYMEWVTFKHVEINGKVLIGDGKGAEKPKTIAQNTPLKGPFKFKKGDSIKIRLTFCEPSRDEARELTREERGKDRETARRKKEEPAKIKNLEPQEKKAAETAKVPAEE